MRSSPPGDNQQQDDEDDDGDYDCEEERIFDANGGGQQKKLRRSLAAQEGPVYAAAVHVAHRTGVAVYDGASNSISVMESYDDPQEW